MMRGRDTSLGGFPKGFPDTSWGVVSRLGDSRPEERSRAFETLCRGYWKPVYRYVRIAWAKSNEESKNLTQAFFLWVLESDPLSDCAPEGGSYTNLSLGCRAALRKTLYSNHREIYVGFRLAADVPER